MKHYHPKDSNDPKSVKLFHSITNIRDSLISNAVQPNHTRKKTFRFAAAAAVFAAAAAICAVSLPPGSQTPTSAHTIAHADYPQSAPYPDENTYTGSSFSEAFDTWWEDVSARRRLTDGYADSMNGFLTKSIRQFLSASPEENTAYSPLNLYIALGMLAELTDTNSRAQLLTLLECQDVTTLRSRIHSLWNANYRDDGATARILASSLWLDASIRYTPSTLKSLTDNYYASSYQGTMGSEQYNRMMHDWLNSQTGGLLKESAANLDILAEDTILALATTVYFRGKWLGEFSPENTSPQAFHAVSGDIDCDFMHKEQTPEDYYWGTHFSAVSQSMGESGSMWFVLPNEGVSIGDLLDDSQAMEFVISKDRSQWEHQKNMLVNLAVPKFDISSQLNLEQGMRALGITDVFNPEKSDFSPMTRDADGIFLSQAKHAVRVAIDEQGVTAAAYTVMSMSGGAMEMPKDVVDFVLDRPFLFFITDAAGLPLFVGTVCQPAANN